MSKKIKVYVASPYTKGDVAVNVRHREVADAKANGMPVVYSRAELYEAFSVRR